MLWLITAITTLAVAQAPAPKATASLERQLRAEIAKSKAEVAVAVRSLDGKIDVLIDPDKQFHAASTMKVPVMIELFRQADAGMLKLDDPLTIRNEFKSIVDGSAYKLSEGDDSDKAMYDALGKTMTLRQLCEAMITVSSNFATNLLIDRLGVENARQRFRQMHGDGAVGVAVLKIQIHRFKIVARIEIANLAARLVIAAVEDADHRWMVIVERGSHAIDLADE